MSIFLMLLQYFPYVLQGVVAVEGAISSAPGATKKQVVMSAVTAAAAVGATVPETHIAAISNLIDSTVTSLNATNMLGFGTSGKLPTVTIPAATV